jgi:hypothetical protein
LTAGALLTAPLVVPVITGVAQAEPAAVSDSVSDQATKLRDALKGAMTAHNERLTAAQTTIRTGVTTQNLTKVNAGVGQINESTKTFVVQVQGILRGSLAPSNTK